MITDLRSDTFTKPTPGMLEAMFNASVGDDVFGEDPSVNQLENMLSSMFGMEAAMFCPSGTMANQIAIKCHTMPGNEVICEKLSHVYIYEGGGIAFNSGSQVSPLEGNYGRITADQVIAAINPDHVYKARTSLVCLENTTNRGGGSCYNFTDIQQIKDVCLTNNLKLHLDGARLWNALIAKKETPVQYGEVFDSISVCLSKGLGAPVGSVLLGYRCYIDYARRIRKVLGGGMRQAGYLAAAGIYALEHNIQRLEDDHKNARRIGEVLLTRDFIGKILPVETNILLFDVQQPLTASGFVEAMKKEGILCLAVSPNTVRMIVHLDITTEMVEKLIAIIGNM